MTESSDQPKSITLTFTTQQFAAIQRLTLFCDPPKGNRRLLQGVNFNYYQDALRLEATDSFAMGLMTFTKLTSLDFTPFIVPATLLSKVKIAKSPRYSSNSFVKIFFDAEYKTVSLSYDGASFTENVIEGAFPVMQSVINALPADPEAVDTIALNPVFIAKIGKWYGSETLKFRFAGERAVCVTSPSSFVDLDIEATSYVMPIRVK